MSRLIRSVGTNLLILLHGLDRAQSSEEFVKDNRQADTRECLETLACLETNRHGEHSVQTLIAEVDNFVRNWDFVFVFRVVGGKEFVDTEDGLQNKVIRIIHAFRATSQYIS